MPVRGSTRNFPAALINFSGIYLIFSHGLVYIISFYLLLISTWLVTPEKEKHFTWSEFFLIFNTLGWY